MRRANGTGQVFKIKEKGRRNPWRARITVAWELDEVTGKSKQVIKTLGYYPSRREAEAALNEYLNNPYSIDGKDMTFEELYNEWSEKYFSSLSGVSSVRTVESAYRYMHPIYKMKVRDIRVRHLEECLEGAYRISDRGKDKGEKRYASACTKGRMKSVFNLMFDFAVRYDIVKTNYARNFEVSKEIRVQKQRDKKEISIFSNEELELLWGNVDKLQFADMVLIGIYTGWRPQELAILKLEDIDLEKNTSFGGLKTEAGKNRYVPIHPLIKELVASRYMEAEKLGSEYLFNDLDGQRGTVMTYDKYRHRFDKVMTRLGMEHRPHETRHTFSTLAKAYNMKDNVRKLIMGHSIIDFTDRVYTHPMLEELQQEMRKIGKWYPYGVTPEFEKEDDMDI
ncbi:MAG: tyrosine-type recombinase/integrase [Lachnospiraceae bacterium]|nr:tyrosine-type recombinase/integrase [Lachnospiraceae bacterium]